jgi:hypothetical protein
MRSTEHIKWGRSLVLTPFLELSPKPALKSLNPRKRAKNRFPKSQKLNIRNQHNNTMIGRFYFKLTAGGNLVGEFSNDSTNRTYTESADRVMPGTSSYLGDYFSTWHEDGGTQAELTKLTITLKGGCNNIYTVIWEEYPSSQVPPKLRFKGEAMLCDDILVGDYSS